MRKNKDNFWGVNGTVTICCKWKKKKANKKVTTIKSKGGVR